jgi:hypothetical protein
LQYSSFEDRGHNQVGNTLKKTIWGERKLECDKKVRICNLSPLVTHQRVAAEE